MSVKYFKRGTREYYQVTPERVIKIVNKEFVSEVYIANGPIVGTGPMFFLTADAIEGTEISREEFAKEFEVASRLIVLEP